MDTCTYLTFDGTCETAMGFYAEALGGKVLMMLKYKEAPTGEPVSPAAAERIMHARIELPGGRLLMASDAPAEHYRTPQGFMVQIGVDRPADAERVFAALAKGGIITMAMAETFWAHRFGMLTDRFGVPWMVNCEKAPA